MNYEQMAIDDICPEGGDTANDCADCVYGEDYHCVKGECLLRGYDPDTNTFGAPKEVTR